MISLADLVRKYGTNSTILSSTIPNYSDGESFVLDMILDKEAKKEVDIDLDPDGLLSGVIALESCVDLGIVNMRQNIPKIKRHGITKECALDYIKRGVKYLVIVDSSSNNLEELEILSNAGVRVLILDHHSCDYTLNDYPKNVVIINNKMSECICKEVSACMLTYLFFSTIYTKFKLDTRPDHYVLGYCSLITDSCKLSDDFIAPIVKSISGFERYIPHFIRMFMTRYDSLNRNFISFKWANKINALTRTDNIELLDKLMFGTRYMFTDQIEELQRQVNDVYSVTSNLTKDFVSKCEGFIDDHNRVGFIDVSLYKGLTELTTQYLVNSTGYLSSEFAKTYGKPVLVAASRDHRNYKCSIRANGDTIDLIDFKNKLNLSGGGHKGAIGFEVSKDELDTLLMYIDMFDFADIQDTSSEPLIVNGDGLGYKDFEHIMGVCAIHNETAGNGMPEVYVTRKLNYTFKLKEYEKMDSYTLGNIVIKSFTKGLNPDDVQYIKPILESKVIGIVQ